MTWTTASISVKLVILAINLQIGPSFAGREFEPAVPGFPFERAAVSLNVEHLERSRLLVQVKCDSGEWKDAAQWPSKTGSIEIRSSGSRALRVRIAGRADPGATIRMMAVAFQRNSAESSVPQHEPGPLKPAELKLGDVSGGSGPARVLAAYLRHWAFTLDRKDLRTSSSTIDGLLPARPGFCDLASASGSYIGIRAYVSYFHSMRDLAVWTDLAPVVCDLAEPVLVEGLFRNGDVSAILARGDSLKRVRIPRAAFVRRWQATGREVMIVQPRGLDTPEQDPESPAWIHLHFEPGNPTPGSGRPSRN